jgi:DNA-binding NtrC family response regulator
MNHDVLVVSTNPSKIGYSGALRGEGRRVARVHLISDAYSLLARGFRPQTVILDLESAELREFLPAVRAILGVKTSIIVLGDNETAPLKHDANIFLTKPVQAEDVLTAVHRAS